MFIIDHAIWEEDGETGNITADQWEPPERNPKSRSSLSAVASVWPRSKRRHVSLVPVLMG